MKTLEQSLGNLDVINQNIEVLFNLNWDVVDPESPCEAYYSLRAINVLLTQIILYVEQYDIDSCSDYFRRLQKNVAMTCEGEKSKEFIFSFTFPEFIKNAREMIEAPSEIDKLQHGGARKGAGRPKKPTKQIRVPEQMVEEVRALCAVFPSHNPDCEEDSDFTWQDNLSLEVLNVLNQLESYVKHHQELKTFEKFKAS